MSSKRAPSASRISAMSTTRRSAAQSLVRNGWLRRWRPVSQVPDLEVRLLFSTPADVPALLRAVAECYDELAEEIEQNAASHVAFVSHVGAMIICNARLLTSA